MKVYLESKLQVESLIGNKVGELECFTKEYWFVKDGFIFLHDKPGISENDCSLCYEIIRKCHVSDEITVFMVDDYVSESAKAIVVMTNKEDKL
ncbi:hypothetical protein OBDJBBDK_00135 [Aeromonas phage AhFM11]|nr:hypothetical protein OBDJBBDK_00135 [Aeromonas phage AhFM11]